MNGIDYIKIQLSSSSLPEKSTTDYFNVFLRPANFSCFTLSIYYYGFMVSGNLYSFCYIFISETS